MTTSRSATEIWLIGNPKSDLNASCLLTKGNACVTFFHIFKNQAVKANDAVNRTINRSCRSFSVVSFGVIIALLTFFKFFPQFKNFWKLF